MMVRDNVAILDGVISIDNAEFRISVHFLCYHNIGMLETLHILHK
jgi:hypothetical protein